MRQIGVMGAGYVGLVSAACLAELGNDVTCIDTNARRIEALGSGWLPFFEPGLAKLVLRNKHAGRLAFVGDVAAGLAGRDIVFIAVGTPNGPDGHLDLSAVRAAARDIALALDGPKVVVNKSTVPVQTADLVAYIIEEHKKAHPVCVVSNPEFLREGSAIADFMQPDRIVIGTTDPSAEARLRELYAPLNAPFIITDASTAEMIKLTANAFLALKVSFINEIADVCERSGADVNDVIRGVGADKRIGASYMNPGLGFGGSCLPKDVRAICQVAETLDAPASLLRAALKVNAERLHGAVQRITTMLGGAAGKRIGVLGLAFKPNTDDVRESPAISLIQRLLDTPTTIVAHDPVANDNARKMLGESVRFVASAYETANDADAVVVATDWDEYKHIDLLMLRKLMAGRTIFDFRNIYDPHKVADAGLTYVGMGRGAARQSQELSTAGERLAAS